MTTALLIACVLILACLVRRARHAMGGAILAADFTPSTSPITPWGVEEELKRCSPLLAIC